MGEAVTKYFMIGKAEQAAPAACNLTFTENEDKNRAVWISEGRCAGKNAAAEQYVYEPCPTDAGSVQRPAQADEKAAAGGYC